MSEFTITKAFIELGVKGEAQVQEVLNRQKLAVDRLQKSIASGAFEAQVKQQNAVNAAMERTKADAQKIINRNMPIADVLPAGGGGGGLGGLLSGMLGKTQLGGMVGMGGESALLAGGPVGAATAVAVKTATSMVNSISSAFNLLKTGSMAEFSSGITQLGSDMFFLSPALSLVTQGFGKFMETATHFASAANPIVAERANDAFRDMNAVIGRIFVPIIEKATQLVRLFSDVLGAILPSTNDVRQAFAAFDPVLTEVRRIAADLAPIFKVVINTHLRMLAAGLKILAEAISLAIEAMKYLPGVAQMLQAGRAMGGGDLPSTYGAGDFRSPSFVGIAEAKNAFMIEALRVSAGESKDEPTGSEQKRQTALLEKMAAGAGMGGAVGSLTGNGLMGAAIGAAVAVFGR